MGGGLGLYYRSQTVKVVEVFNTSFISNSAAYFSSTQFVAPSRNSSHVEQGGGGVVVHCFHRAQHVHVSFTGCEFTRNKATYGGGICTVVEGYARNISVDITDTHFIENIAGQVGGGLTHVLNDYSNATSVHVKRSTFKRNRARFAGGINIFIGNKVTRRTSVMRFSEVLIQSNFARDLVGSAIRVYATAPFGVPLDAYPEFNNCNITEHAVCEQVNTLFGAVIVRKSELNFTGFNYFTRNTVAGAMFLEESKIHVAGRLVFEKNKGRFGGAINLQGSKILLYPHSELSFIKNSASSVGGAIAAVTSGLPDLVHEYNPGCFLAYSQDSVPHSQWKVKVSFIGNFAGLKGGAIYATSLVDCVWSEKAPHLNYSSSLRWSDQFVYAGNSISGYPGGPSSGRAVDIATGTVRFEIAGESQSQRVAPGETMLLNVTGIDELGHSVYTVLQSTVSGTHSDDFVLNNPFSTVQPYFSSPLVMSYRANSYPGYRKLVEMQPNMSLSFSDVFSEKKYKVNINLIPAKCHPGFVFCNETMKCVCDDRIEGVLRCENGSKVFLRPGYWAGVVNGKFSTYFCPTSYCRCKSNATECLYDYQHPDRQCIDHRRGTLCGSCSLDRNVGLLAYKCLKCNDNDGWLFAVVVILVLILTIAIIWLNPTISSEFRGPLFFFQILPFMFEPDDSVGSTVQSVSLLFKFGGPFNFILKSACVIKGLNNLEFIILGYLMPFVVLSFLLIVYLLSSSYIMVVNFSRRVMVLQPFWLLVFLMYTILTETTLLLLHCPTISGKSVFFYDGNVTCYEDLHLAVALIAMANLVLIVVLPVSVVVIVKGWIKTQPHFIDTLTHGLRTGCSWWWCVDMVRRFVIISLYVFIPDWELKRFFIVVASVVIFGYHCFKAPYKKARANSVESVYLFLLFLLAMLQTCLNHEILVSYTSGLIVSVTLLHAILLTAWKAYLFFLKKCRSESSLLDQHDEEDSARGVKDDDDKDMFDAMEDRFLGRNHETSFEDSTTHHPVS